MSELSSLTLEQAASGLRAGDFTSRELTDAALARVESVEPAVGAFLHVAVDGARQAAEAADARLRDGDAPPLCGIPGGLKDLITTVDMPTTAASRIIEGYVSPYEAFVTRQLRGQGGVVLGKLNLDEFAMGSSTETSAYQLTHNPFAPSCVPGGSSGGSAAAVAAEECFWSLGTDTGGSIRQPAAFCGVVGMKPTYGRVSRAGVMALASSLDQVGPMARTVRDCALVLEAIAGPDPADATSAARPVEPYREACGCDIKGLKIGVPREYFVDGMQPEVAAAVRAAIDQYETLGAIPVEISLPHTDFALATYYIIMTSEVSANLARFDGIRYGVPQVGETMWDAYCATRGEGFGAEVKRRIMLGTYVLSAGYYDAYYVRAQRVRTLIKQDFERAFAQVDAVVCPATPTTAFAIGERVDDPMQMYLTDVFTLALNLAGLPGLVQPCGFDGQNKPIGLQLIAPAWQEARLFQLAYAYEQASGTAHPNHRARLAVGQGGGQ